MFVMISCWKRIFKKLKRVMSEITSMVHYQCYPVYYKMTKFADSIKMEKNAVQKGYHILAAVGYIAANCHMLVVGYNVLTTRWDIITAQYGLGVQFISLWNMMFHNIYFYYSLKEDFMPNNDPRKQELKKRLSVAFHSIVFPLTFQVITLFWPLYFYNVKLLDKFNALATQLKNVNYTVHFAVVPAIILELFFADRPKEFVSLGIVFVNSMLVSFAYLFVVYFLNFLSGEWPYPILTMFSPLLISLGTIINGIVAIVIWKIFCRLKDNVTTLISDTSNKNL